MIKEGFILRKFEGLGMNLVMPVGIRVKEFQGVLTLNDTGAFVFAELQSGKTIEEVAQSLTHEYDVALEKAKNDVEKTIASLKEAGVIKEEN